MASHLRLFDGALTAWLALGGTLQDGDLVRTRNGSLWKVIPRYNRTAVPGYVFAARIQEGHSRTGYGPTNTDVKINKLVGLYRGCLP